MTHARLWSSAGIITAILFAGFVFSVPRAEELPREAAMEASAAVQPSVRMADSFKKGVHTIRGVIEAPNACTSATAEATLVGDETAGERILVAVSMPIDDGICLKIPTDVKWSATLTAPANLPIAVTVNGIAATTTAP